MKNKWKSFGTLEIYLKEIRFQWVSVSSFYSTFIPYKYNWLKKTIKPTDHNFSVENCWLIINTQLDSSNTFKIPGVCSSVYRQAIIIFLKKTTNKQQKRHLILLSFALLSFHYNIYHYFCSKNSNLLNLFTCYFLFYSARRYS